jgi:hypothetical protein
MRGHGILSEAEIYQLPRPPVPGITAAGFTMCPVVFQHGHHAEHWQCQQLLYRWAFEQAQAVVRPSLPERKLMDVWN